MFGIWIRAIRENVNKVTTTQRETESAKCIHMYHIKLGLPGTAHHRTPIEHRAKVQDRDLPRRDT